MKRQKNLTLEKYDLETSLFYFLRLGIFVIGNVNHSSRATHKVIISRIEPLVAEASLPRKLSAFWAGYSSST